MELQALKEFLMDLQRTFKMKTNLHKIYSINSPRTFSSS